MPLSQNIPEIMDPRPLALKAHYFKKAPTLGHHSSRNVLLEKKIMYLDDIFQSKIFSTFWRKGSYIFEVEHYIPKRLSM